MTEKLLQYLWNFKIFKSFDFKDVEGTAIEILDFGKWNHDSGPDFLLAKLKTKNFVLAGHIELHTKASDWYFHGHEGDTAYENLILHAVFINDCDIPELKNRNIPTLELRNFIDEKILWKYDQILTENQFIPCEKIFNPAKIPFNFAEETLLKKLDAKSEDIEEALKFNKNNYEAVLFQNLAYAFGLKVNAQIFKQIAESIDFSVIQKIRQNQTQLEALFFGISGWLQEPLDGQSKIWKREFDFLKSKYQLPEITISPKFLRLRPPNFPTLRLSQLANLYHKEQNLFSKIINAETPADIFKIFEGTKASAYWDNHFNFGKECPSTGEKTLTKDFVELVIINAVLPIKYTYHKHHDEEIAEKILKFYHQIKPEKNTITESWKALRTPMNSALDSQAYIFHHKNYCERKNCLNCSIGFQLLKETAP